MRFRALLTCAFLGLLLAGCKSVPLRADGIDPRTPESPGQSIFTIDWQAKLVGTQLFEYFPREFGSPAVDPDSRWVFAGTRDGKVRAVSGSGKVEWTFATGGPFTAGPSVRDGVVYVPGGDGVLYALRARDGGLLWKYASGEPLATAPVLSEGRIYVASQASTLFAVEAQTGKWLWQYRRDLPAGFTVIGTSAPTINMGVLYCGFPDGAVVALDPESGIVKWERVISTPDRQFLDVDTRPFVDDQGKVIVASFKDGIFALNGKDGSIYWNAKISGVTGLIGRGNVVFASGERGMTSLLTEDGRVVWTLPMGKKAAGAPVFARGLLVVPVQSALAFVDPATGTERLTWDPGEGVSATPTWDNQQLFVLSNTGFLYAMSLDRSRR